MELEPIYEKASLLFIELSNFKSFSGVHCIGPLDRNFIAVLGLNGAGKSNLTDAVGFVLNEKTKHLRAKHLGDVIHGSVLNNPTASNVYVKVTFVVGRPAGEDITLSRHVVRLNETRYSNVYKIQDDEVSEAAYMAKLSSIGINTKAKNFMIFQGQIESMASLTPRERTVMLEELSGYKMEVANRKFIDAINLVGFYNISIKFKSEYDRLRSELDQSVTEEKKSRQLLNTIRDDFKKLRKMFERNVSLEQLQEQLEHDKLQLFLSQLYLNQRRTDTLLAKRANDEEFLSESLIEHDKVANELSESKKEHLKVNKRLIDAEQSFYKLVTELQSELELIKDQEEEEDISMDDNSPDGSMFANQVTEYYTLRAAVHVSAQESFQQTQIVSDSLLSVKSQLCEEERKLEDLRAKLHYKTAYLTKLDENITEINKKISSFKSSAIKLETVESKFQRLDEIRGKLLEISEEEKQDDIAKSFREAAEKRRCVLVELQANFKGIHGRLADVCRPCHQRFQIAVTKVMGHKMNAIVCDSVQVAHAAIEHLKTRRLHPETFLPLDYLHVTSVDDNLKRVVAQVHSNARFIVDIVTFDPKFKNAILHCFGQTAVCDSADDARLLATRDKCRAVSVDGTMFEVSGIISGGLEDLVQKSKQWNLSSDVGRQRLDAKRALEKELDGILTTNDKQMSRGSIRMEISSFAKRIDVAEKQKNCEIRARDSLIKEIQQLENDIKLTQVEKRNLDAEFVRLNEAIDKLNESVKVVEDQVFASFCTKLQVPNIRVFDERFNDVSKVEILTIRKQMRLDRDTHIRRLENQISYDSERTLSLEKDAQKYKDAIRHCEKTYHRLTRLISTHGEEIDTLLRQMETRSLQVESMKKEVSSCLETSLGFNGLIDEIEVKIAQIKSELLENESRLEFLRRKRHELLLYAKSEPLEIENAIALDYSSLQHLHQISDKQLSASVLDMEKQLDDLRSDIEDLRAKVDPATGKKKSSVLLELKSRERRYEAVLKRLEKARVALNRVREKRMEAFMSCYEVISNHVNATYKALLQSQEVHAMLDLESAEEPYLSGITFGCIPPGKRYRRVEDLSGGEKTLAALTFIFSLQTYRRAPVVIMDEIDASLDVSNINKVANYLKTCGYQVVVISLKEQFYSQSNALLGIANEVSQNAVTSSFFTGFLDLDLYADNRETPNHQ